MAKYYPAKELTTPKKQIISTELYVLAEFDDDGNFVKFLENSGTKYTTVGYVGARAAKYGRDNYRRRNPDKIIEALWVGSFKPARFYNRKGERTISRISESAMRKWRERTLNKTTFDKDKEV